MGLACTVADQAYRTLLWVLLLGAFACFTFITWARPTEWYRLEPVISKEISSDWTIPFPGDVPVLTGVVLRNGKNTTVLLGRNSTLMSGGTIFPVLLQWGSVLLAALCTVGLLPGWRKKSATSKAYEQPAHPVIRAYSRFCAQLRRIATYPLPPRRFWAWFCGGLNAVEILFFATWLALCVTYCYYLFDRSFRNIGSQLTPPPPSAAALRAPPVSGPVTGVPATQALPAIFLSRRLNASGKLSGELLRVMVMVMFFPVSRSCFLKWLFGTDFSYLIKFHRWMSWGTIWVSTAHGILYTIQYGCAGTIIEEYFWEVDHRNVTGLLSTMGALLIACTSLAWIRANYYRVFYYSHIIGFLAFIIFGLMHYKGFVNWIMAPLILYGLDRAFRLWQLSSNWTRVQPCDMSVDGSVLTLRLMYTADSRIQPGQTVYLRVPGVSWLQSHPFSISNVELFEGGGPDGAPLVGMTVNLKVVGSWTRGLRRLALSGQPVLVQVQGPYDTSLETMPKGPVVVLIAGGIGVTPLLGLLRHYLSYPMTRPSNVYLIWSSRTMCELRLLGADLLAAVAPDVGNPNPMLNVSIGNNESPTGATTPSPAEDSWLHPYLSYTGCETDPSDKTGMITRDAFTRHMNTSGTASSEDAADGSPQAYVPGKASTLDLQLMEGATGQDIPTANKPVTGPSRPLTAHPLAQPAVYAVCLLLAFFGCFAGLITAAYIDGYYARTTELGMFYPTCGVVQFFILTVAIIVPPVAFLASLPAIASCASRLGITWFTPTKGEGATDSYRSSPGPTLEFASGMRLVPSNPMDMLSKGGEGVMGLSVGRGRPDVAALLRRVKQAHMRECTEIEVLAGGPPVMWEGVVEACVQVGAEPGPALRARRVAHQH